MNKHFKNILRKNVIYVYMKCKKNDNTFHYKINV